MEAGNVNFSILGSFQSRHIPLAFASLESKVDAHYEQVKNNKQEISELRKRLWKIAGAGGAIGTGAALVLKALEYFSGR